VAVSTRESVHIQDLAVQAARFFGRGGERNDGAGNFGFSIRNRLSRLGHNRLHELCSALLQATRNRVQQGRPLMGRLNARGRKGFLRAGQRGFQRG
jgi:hypothetical protein